eukprot:366399-Chlamydomonas_euryale.AAC.19
MLYNRRHGVATAALPVFFTSLSTAPSKLPSRPDIASGRKLHTTSTASETAYATNAKESAAGRRLDRHRRLRFESGFGTERVTRVPSPHARPLLTARLLQPVLPQT